MKENKDRKNNEKQKTAAAVKDKQEISLPEGQNVIKEDIKKSELKAASRYDYQWITYKNDLLVPMDIKQSAKDSESITISYQVRGMKPVSDIREEDRLDRLLILWNAGKVFELNKKYYFTTNPKNLYYDLGKNVRVRKRDVTAGDSQVSESYLVDCYKSLTGFALQNKYDYADYLNGGMQLMQDDGFLSGIQKLTSIDDIRKALYQEYLDESEDRKANYVLVGRQKENTRKLLLKIFTVAAIALAAVLTFDYVYIEPYQKASIALGEDYLLEDYEGAIDAMEKVSINRMTTPQRYMLAACYVREQDLTAEQKSNVLGQLSMKDSVLRLDYWIYIGRNDVEDAKNAALQLSDVQLQLFAYMKEKSLVSTDASLSGEEKQKKIDELDKNLQDLNKKYSTEEEDGSK